jgi:hypothetical protein
MAHDICTGFFYRQFRGIHILVRVNIASANMINKASDLGQKVNPGGYDQFPFLQFHIRQYLL